MNLQISYLCIVFPFAPFVPTFEMFMPFPLFMFARLLIWFTLLRLFIVFMFPTMLLVTLLRLFMAPKLLLLVLLLLPLLFGLFLWGGGGGGGGGMRGGTPPIWLSVLRLRFGCGGMAGNAVASADCALTARLTQYDAFDVCGEAFAVDGSVRFGTAGGRCGIGGGTTCNGENSTLFFYYILFSSWRA